MRLRGPGIAVRQAAQAGSLSAGLAGLRGRGRSATAATTRGSM